MHVQYIPGLGQSRLGAADHAVIHIAFWLMLQRLHRHWNSSYS